MKIATHTVQGGTNTTEGFIPHMQVGRFALPVLLDVDLSTAELPQKPVRSSSGEFIYVGPGGRWYLPAKTDGSGIPAETKYNPTNAKVTGA